MRRVAAILAFFLLAGSAFAQNNSTRASSNFITPLGYCQFTASSSAQTLSAASCATPVRTAWAVICIETAGIRWRDDGTAPTASVGMPVAAAQCFYYNGTFSALSIIAQSGSPVVDISFYDGPGLQ